MYLIDEDYIKANTRITKGTGNDWLEPYLRDVQEIHVQDLLGIPLLEKYLKYTADDTSVTLSPIQLALLTNIKKFFAKRVEYEYVLLGSTKLNSKGVTSADGVVTDAVTLEKVRTHIASQYNTYSDRILKALAANKTEFPEYYANENDKPSLNTVSRGFNFKPLPKKYFY